MNKNLLLVFLLLLIITVAFSIDNFSLAIFGVGKYTNVDSVGNIGLYSNTPSYEFSSYGTDNTVYIGISQIDTKIASATFSLYLNDSSTPISGYSDIPIPDNGIKPDVLANDGVFTYSLNLLNISSLKHNDIITVKVVANFADGSTVTRKTKFLIDNTYNFNTYKVGDIRNGIFNSGEKLKVNFNNYTPINLNTDSTDNINNLKLSEINNTLNFISLNNVKRNDFFVKISDPSNPSDVVNPIIPIFSASHLSIGKIKAIKYAYSGAWKEQITSGNEIYIRKDYIKYLSFTADNPSQWWKITALGICASPTTPPSTMTFKLVDSNGTTVASFTGPAKSENVSLKASGVDAEISVDDPSKLATQTETTMLYIEEFSENFIFDFKPHIYGIEVSQNPTYEKNNVTISFYTDFSGSVDFIIYDYKGSIVYTSSQNVLMSKDSQDRREFIWNFKNLDGKRVATGQKYYFKIIPFIVDTSSNESIYGPFVYGSLFLRLPVGKLTGANPSTLKTGSKLSYSYNLSENATVEIKLNHENKVFYSTITKVPEPGDYTNSFTIPASAADGIYKLIFDAKTLYFETITSTTITIDNTPPTISFSLSQHGTSIIVNGTTDINSGGINTTYNLYKSFPKNLVLKRTLTKNITNGKLDVAFNNTDNGYYVLDITVKDPVGNTASLRKGIEIGGNGSVLTEGSTIVGPNGILTISIPSNAVLNSYSVSITSEASGNALIYTFNPEIVLTKYATITISLSSTPISTNKFFVSEYDNKINLMTKLSSKTTMIRVKKLQKVYIKDIQQVNALQINCDKIVKSSPMQIYINNFEKIKIAIFILDLKGNMIKVIMENESLEPGSVEEDWDLTDKYGITVPNGQYILYAVSDKGKIAKLFGVKK